MDTIIRFFAGMEFNEILTIIAILGAAVSGVGLLVIRKRRREQSAQEEEYQKRLAASYREAWLNSQASKGVKEGGNE